MFADITIVPVSTDRKDAYLEFARRMAEVYREHGATRIVDYWQVGTGAEQADFHADGVSYDPDELSGLGDRIGATSAESVVVTVMEWPSKEARDRGTAAATKDSRVTGTVDEDPVFDGGRLIGESFEVTMRLSAEP